MENMKMPRSTFGLRVAAALVAVLVVGAGSCSLFSNDLDMLFRTVDDSGSGLAHVAAEPRAPGDVTLDQVYFRSSDIEFWDVSSAAEIGEIFSAKYQRFGGVDEALSYENGRSLEYYIGDASQSFVFEPGRETTVDVTNLAANPGWDNEVAAFVAAGKTRITLMRLDIGAGVVTFVSDGMEIQPELPGGDAGNYINGNSMVFVDRSLVSVPVLLTRDLSYSIQQGATGAADLGVSEAEFEIIEAINASSNVFDAETPIDVNGALLVPMTPVDLSAFDPDTQAIEVTVSWDMTGVAYEDNGTIYTEDRIGGTAFDFDVQVTTVDVDQP
jgi:hypothetical protein